MSTGLPGGVAAAPDVAAATPRPWWEFTLVVLARGYRTALLALAAIAVAPVLWGWQSYLVTTGSMAPVIAPGDVVLARPTDTRTAVELGRVYLFDDPAPPTRPRVLVHRVTGVDADGDFITRGDANPSPDPVHVPPEAFRARGTLLAPWIGLPVQWWHDQRWWLLGPWGAATGAALRTARRRLDEDPPPGSWGRLARSLHPSPPAGRRGRPRPARGAPRGAAPTTYLTTALALTLAFTVALVPQTAGAALRATTTGAPSTFSTAANLRLPYVAAVEANNPSGFWLLDETSGTTLANRAAPSNPGTLSGTATLGGTGALPGGAVTFSQGSVAFAPVTTQLLLTEAFSFEFWFRAPAPSSGAERFLAGFQLGNSPTTATPRILLDSNGRVTATGATLGVLQSSTGKADNQWHHVVLTVTASVAGLGRTSTLYVDGVNEGAGTALLYLNLVSQGQWRIGSGHTNGGIPAAALTFNGSIDAVALYPHVLTAAQVAAHHAAR